MKTRKNLARRILAVLCCIMLFISAFPFGNTQAASKPGIPTIKVKVSGSTDAKVTIGKTEGAEGFEVWVTSNTGYKGYKNYNDSYKYDYLANPGNFVNAATIEKDGNSARSIILKNLSKGKISIKVRAYTLSTSQDGSTVRNYGEFSKSKNVKIKEETVGYKTSYDFSKVKIGETIKFGSYEQDYPADGKDAIEWIVLDKTKNGIFVISKYILDSMPYNMEWVDVTWETCSLRKWLNNKFYNVAFNKTEKSMIKKTTVKTGENYNYHSDGGKNTKDKIFLLSMDEITDSKYGFEKWNSYEVDRRTSATKYAAAQGAYYDDRYPTEENIGSCWWWLRTPGIQLCHATLISLMGTVQGSGSNVDSYYGAGVRPAMYLKLKS